MARSIYVTFSVENDRDLEPTVASIFDAQQFSGAKLVSLEIGEARDDPKDRQPDFIPFTDAEIERWIAESDADEGIEVEDFGDVVVASAPYGADDDRLAEALLRALSGGGH